MACANRRAEASSSGRSLRVLRLVSMARTIVSGKADSLSKTAIFCALVVFLQLEIFFFQGGDGSAVLVGHGDEHVHQLDVNFESR